MLWVGPRLVFGAAGLLKLLRINMAQGDLLTRHAWPYVVSLAAAGVICVGLGVDNYGGERAIDASTGLRIDTGPRHSLYGLAVQYWGMAYFVLAGLLFVPKPF